MYDEHDDFRRIFNERAELLDDCERLGGVTIERSRRLGFTEPTHGKRAGDAGGSGFPIDYSDGYHSEGRPH